MLLNSIQINILSVPRSGTLNPVHNNCDDLPSIPEGVEAPTPWSNVPLSWDIQTIQTQLLSYIHINKHMSNHHWPVNTNGCGHSYRSTMVLTHDQLLPYMYNCGTVKSWKCTYICVSLQSYICDGMNGTHTTLSQKHSWSLVSSKNVTKSPGSKINIQQLEHSVLAIIESYLNVFWLILINNRWKFFGSILILLIWYTH